MKRLTVSDRRFLDATNLHVEIPPRWTEKSDFPKEPSGANELKDLLLKLRIEGIR